MNMVNLVPHVYLYGENGMFEPKTWAHCDHTWVQRNTVDPSSVEDYFACVSMQPLHLLLSQDLEAQHESGSLANRSIGSIDQVRFRTEWRREMMQNLSAPTFEMPLELFSVEKFNKLASWLGANCTFTSVAHSNAARGTQTQESSKQASCE